MLVLPVEVELDLPQQFTLHLCPDINGILGDENGDSATFNSNVSDATLATSKTAPCTPINYLLPISTTPIPPPVLSEDETPTFVMDDSTNMSDDETSDPPPTKTPKTSAEDTPNNRLEGPAEN